MIGEQAPLGRDNQEREQNELQTIKSAFTGGTLVLRAQDRHVGVAVGGGGGSFCKEVSRSHGESHALLNTQMQGWPPPALSTCV